MAKKLLWLALLVPLLVFGGVAGLAWLAPDTATGLAIQAERRASGLHERRVTVDGLDWVLLEGGPDGDTAPPLVLIHGFGGDKDNWTRVARTLTQTQRVLIPDLIGFGDSDQPPISAGYTVPQQAERLHRLLQQLGISKLHLGGNSMGGWIASTYAAAHPDAVLSLWLLAPAGVANADKSEMVQFMEAGGALPLVVHDRAEFDARLNWVFGSAPPLPGFVRKTMTARAAANALLHEQIRQQLYGVSPPQETVLGNSPAAQLSALIVWGSKDRILHPSGASVLRGLMPNSTSILLPGVGHLPMVEQPQQCAADYLKWRAGLLP
ncbi:alpha/beta hydrolase [Stagnimonas aquatica]|uniref:Alpha/beta hydrolase n=1 Tax=Stagnimonas aquatica TaxID=2689987 RepID=A0A3N0VLL9_9GAMM|nr:alpha/beta hydrolase [Stagnimonas aquatica]ROH92978.1 alpha/beta hydrolase [Stagnimonas aquatica]